MIKYNKDVTLEKGQKILVFSTEWCPDCIYLDNFILEIEKENIKYEFIYVNSDENIELVQKYEIYGIPSFVALKAGKVQSKLVSKDRKTKSLINSWIKTIGIL